MIKLSDLSLVSSRSPVDTRSPVFHTASGDPVYLGDTVSFIKDGEHLPTSGTISNINGLHVDCFSTLLNKWRSYYVEE